MPVPISVTVKGTRTGELVTVNTVLPKMFPEMAVIVVGPGPTLVAKPELEMVATPVDEELQVTVLVRFCVLPSL